MNDGNFLAGFVCGLFLGGAILMACAMAILRQALRTAREAQKYLEGSRSRLREMSELLQVPSGASNGNSRISKGFLQEATERNGGER
jgi:hypothetical protein